MTKDLKSAEEYREVPIELVFESPFNTRTRHSKEAHAKLVASMQSKGQLTPGTARPVENDRFELAAGARRLKALQEIGAKTMKLIVRPMTDTELLEIIVIENNQREDVHPLEEAQGFKELMLLAKGYDPARIAKEIGRSDQYVYDRLRLLQLIDPAQELFLAGRILPAHAVILSRLNAADQERALFVGESTGMGYNVGGLWQPERDGELFASERDQEESEDPYHGLKAVTPRELQVWVNDHVRFDPKADETAAQLFPDTVKALEAAAWDKRKVVRITYHHRTPDALRDENVKVLGVDRWRRADGNEGSNVCDHSTLGLVDNGPSRGETFEVCVKRDTCEVHWAAEIKEKRRREKEKQQTQERAASGDATAAAKLERDQKRQAAEAAKREEERKRNDLIYDRIFDACKKAVAGSPDKACAPDGTVGAFVLRRLDELREVSLPWGTKLPKPGAGAAGIVRWLAAHMLDADGSQGNPVEDSAKLLGVDVKAIVKAVDAELAPPKPKPAAKKSSKPTAKKKAKK